MTFAHPTLMAASQIQDMSKKTSNERLAMVFTGLSVGLIGLMAVKELREMFRDTPRHHEHRRDFDRHFDDGHHRGR